MQLNPNSFGEQLKYARQKSNLTQKELGEAIGKSKIFICQLENNYCLPTKADFDKINHILKNRLTKTSLSRVITPKIQVITATKSKPRVNTYTIHIEAHRDDFPLLSKSNLKKCGFRGLRDIFAEGYSILKGRLKSIEQTLINNKTPTYPEIEQMLKAKERGEIETVSTIVDDKLYYFTIPQKQQAMNE